MAVQTVYAFAPLLQLMPPEAAAAGAYRGGAMLREQIAGLPNAVTGVKSPRATITDAPVVYRRRRRRRRRTSRDVVTPGCTGGVARFGLWLSGRRGGAWARDRAADLRAPG